MGLQVLSHNIKFWEVMKPIETGIDDFFFSPLTKITIIDRTHYLTTVFLTAVKG